MLSTVRRLLEIAVVVLALPATAAAQSPCDPTLDLNERRSSGYRFRPGTETAASPATPDRCEGIYTPRRNSFGFRLVAFTAASMLVDLCMPGQRVYLMWPSPTGMEARPIQLRVASLRRNLDYQLDTTLTPDMMRYEWPTNPRCNSDVRLGATELGGAAMTSVALGAERHRRDVYLPVAVAADAQTRAAPPYRVVLSLGSRAEEVSFGLSRYRADQTLEEVFPPRALGRRPYVEGTRVAIELSAADVKAAGLYQLATSVDFGGGKKDAQEYDFLHVP